MSTIPVVRPMTPAERADFVTYCYVAAQAGFNLVDVAQAYRVDPKAARARLVHWGCADLAATLERHGRRPSAPAPPEPEPELDKARQDRLETIIELTTGGASPAQVCQKLGIKPHSLARWMSRNGLKEMARIYYREAKK